MVQVTGLTTSNIEMSIVGSGKITVTQGLFSDHTTTSKTVILNNNTQAQFLFTPDKGWKFTGWSGPNGDTSVQNPVMVDIIGDSFITANSEKVSTDPLSQAMDWIKANPIAGAAILISLPAGVIVGSRVLNGGKKDVNKSS